MASRRCHSAAPDRRYQAGIPARAGRRECPARPALPRARSTSRLQSPVDSQGVLGPALRDPHFRTSLLGSSLDCNIFCDDITSIHHPSCSGFSAGSERFGGVILTRSIGCLVNLEIEAEAFSRSLLTISAASVIASRNFLIAAAFLSAHSRELA